MNSTGVVFLAPPPVPKVTCFSGVWGKDQGIPGSVSHASLALDPAEYMTVLDHCVNLLGLPQQHATNWVA